MASSWGTSWLTAWADSWGVIAAATTIDGAPARGTKRRRSKYPRRVSIDGQMYWVRNAEEERQLLRAHVEKLEAQARALERQDAPKQRVAQAKVKVVRAERRLEKVDNREAEWLDRLRKEDEEILMAVLH